MEAKEVTDKDGESLGYCAFNAKHSLAANDQLTKLGGHYAPDKQQVTGDLSIRWQK
jgi:hypothetical protein